MSEEKTGLIDLLNEMIDASSSSIEIPLNMETWHCGTSCCACGDVAVYRGKNKEKSREELGRMAVRVSYELDARFENLMGSTYIASSIYHAKPIIRGENLQLAGVTEENLTNHPHVTTDHSDRPILIDYIHQLIKYIETKYK